MHPYLKVEQYHEIHKPGFSPNVTEYLHWKIFIGDLEVKSIGWPNSNERDKREMKKFVMQLEEELGVKAEWFDMVEQTITTIAPKIGAPSWMTKTKCKG